MDAGYKGTNIKLTVNMLSVMLTRAPFNIDQSIQINKSQQKYSTESDTDRELHVIRTRDKER